jgi:predicted dehydrogenase
VAQPGRLIACSDSFSAQIRFDGAIAALVYSGGGDSRMPKERLEVFGGGVAALLDDFRRLDVYRGGKRRSWKSSKDKGHREEIAAFVAAVRGQEEAPSTSSYLASTRLTLALVDSLQTGLPVDLGH